MLSPAEEDRKLCCFPHLDVLSPWLWSAGRVNLFAQDLEEDSRPKHSGRRGTVGTWLERGRSLMESLGFLRGKCGLRRRQCLRKRPSFAYANFKLFLISNRPVFSAFRKESYGSLLSSPSSSAPLFLTFFDPKPHRWLPCFQVSPIFPKFSKILL